MDDFDDQIVDQKKKEFLDDPSQKKEVGTSLLDYFRETSQDDFDAFLILFNGYHKIPESRLI